LLYETVLRLAEPAADDTVFDLYCGIGSISLLLARRAAFVYGLEIQEEAVAAARENARLNDVTNAAFSAGDVRKLLKPLVEGAGRDLPLPAFAGGQGQVAPPSYRPDVVLTDPPRAGMSKKAVERTALLGAARLVYVSCNPTTLASAGKRTTFPSTGSSTMPAPC
jgi:23S rRNA (uracil1939-C5)-methyltransferase